ncbi:MAG: 2-oxoglutarate ferredoxin oxidoreductase subunit delta [Thermotogaceae bacterium]|nr:2-oxoglutarate ferredoxin oxidoreductase subunit delta [Thermotogaceae bacterium]MDN5338043.1 2-oxoglutarate ferredoxin oxidoreductase subunit delta [Thermotogaceae bacterium]
MKREFYIKINLDYCKRCGICSWICPAGAITVGELDIPVADDTKCIGCRQCENHCPDFAIDIIEKERTESLG